LNSSENDRIVTAGPTNEKDMGRGLKKFLKFAWLNKKKVEKKSHPVTRRKMEMTM